MLAKPSHCHSCLGWKWNTHGYVPASGTGSNGVLVVAEAAGEDEAQGGMPLIGKSGHYLWSSLSRVGIEREGFRVHNVLSCRPPDNKLVGMPYMLPVINSCAPLLDATIQGMRDLCATNGKTFTILTLGKTAFKRIMGIEDKSPLLKVDYLNYPIWNERYGAYIIACDHPSYLIRGYHHLLPVLQFGFGRALDIASGGLDPEQTNYLLDPEPVIFQQWVKDYLRVKDDVYLSYDIETPFKQGKDEEDVAKEDDSDYTILRCSFAYEPGKAVSVPWNAQYTPILEELFASDGPKVGWNNEGYDSQRVRAQMPINGVELDAMLAWHVLNTSMPKALGFVTPFYWKNCQMWKHLSSDEPAFYNAKDADAALRNWLGIQQNLKDNNLWTVFHNHIVRLNRVFSYMSEKGVKRDEALRAEAEQTLTTQLDKVEQEMAQVVPFEARKIDKTFKNTPKDVKLLIEDGFENDEIETITGLYPRGGMRVQSSCSHCGLEKPGKAHFKKFARKVNQCADARRVERPVEVVEWFRLRDWKVSKDQLLGYQRVKKHQPIIDRKKGSITFDENALIKLQKKYPSDKLYPLILDFREAQKLLGTYVGVTNPDTGRITGGMPIGRDGRIHSHFTHNPSTLRSASQQPNLQNLPRPNPSKPDDYANLIRNLIVASEGNIFTATDFAGIEAVLVGWMARAPDYIRLARRDIHSFYTAYALNALDGRISSNDLPQLSWDDDKLFTRLEEIKKEFKHDRNSLYKHLVHAANYAQQPKGAQEKILNETGTAFPVQLIAKVMGIYYELFPEIKKWHSLVLLQAEKDGFLRNPYGYVHRFNKVFEYEKIGTEWVKSHGPESNKVIAFGPQSTAAGIIKDAMLRLYYDRFEEAGQYLRLLIHDELFAECPLDKVDEVQRIMEEEMGKPIPELRLPQSYNMGDMLTILVESKRGIQWGKMK